MKARHLFFATVLGGFLFFPLGNKAFAQGGLSQDLVTRLLYGLVVPGGTYDPYAGAPYDPYAGSRYDPYGGSRYDPYPSDPRGSYSPFPGIGDPYGYGRQGYDRRDYDRRDYDRRYERRDGLQNKYGKAMNRLDRQEREAREKAYRDYQRGKISPGKFRDRMGDIGRKYSHKRDKVERNTAKDYRKLDRRFDR
jgi:hypothetical protein